MEFIPMNHQFYFNKEQAVETGNSTVLANIFDTPEQAFKQDASNTQPKSINYQALQSENIKRSEQFLRTIRLNDSIIPVATNSEASTRVEGMLAM